MKQDKLKERLVEDADSPEFSAALHERTTGALRQREMPGSTVNLKRWRIGAIAPLATAAGIALAFTAWHYFQVGGKPQSLAQGPVSLSIQAPDPLEIFSDGSAPFRESFAGTPDLLESFSQDTHAFTRYIIDQLPTLPAKPETAKPL